jgi:hypothetical protein
VNGEVGKRFAQGPPVPEGIQGKNQQRETRMARILGLQRSRLRDRFFIGHLRALAVADSVPLVMGSHRMGATKAECCGLLRAGRESLVEQADRATLPTGGFTMKRDLSWLDSPSAWHSPRRRSRATRRSRPP